MDFSREKIRVMVEKLDALRCRMLRPLAFSYIKVPAYKQDNTPPSPDAGWQPPVTELRLEGVDAHCWFHLKLEKAEPAPDKQLRLSVKTGREGQWDADNPQGLVYLNGRTAQGLDTNHTWLPLEYDTEYDIYIYFYTGMEGGSFEVQMELLEADLAVEGLYYDVAVPFLCLEELESGSYDYIRIRDALDKALLRLDLREFYTPAFYDGMEAARAYLKKEFYEKECGNSPSTISCIGHTHIDVAWLWTVAQTREKAQRSFATVVNMMDCYDDYKFMSSQPQLYQYVKEQDPALYARIKELVAAGRWEVEGAMWLEADCNLISGESMVRQILHGKRFMREEFGVESNILWLPDVFGYSAALPQILKKSGVDRFFTAKMSWSESNELPHDTFIWEGVDGSQVFASLVHSYVQRLHPHDVYDGWKRYKDKSMTDGTLLTFGYGDGGGGPTYEMVEHHRRLQYGLPGMPKTVIEKAGSFFDRTEKNFRENAAALKNTPKWVGELYLEKHRGTYTSIGKNKRSNRKSELLYQEAETVAVTDMLLHRSAYPAETLYKNQINILLNQFHDIVPGSSIKAVYDVTDEEYTRILKEGSAIVEAGLERIAADLKTDGGVFVYNPTPFEQSDYLSVDGQRIYAENIPAHGWRVVADTAAPSGVAVTEFAVENDLLRVLFDEKYHIVSIYDKEAGREVLAAGAAANVLEVFEDYPRDLDAWEITSYYKQKMWIADRVDAVHMLEDGIQIRRRYKNSVIEQNIRMRQGSKRIDFETTVDWHEDHVLLKAAFPVDIRSDRAVYEIQFGHVERPTHANNSWEAAKFEVCGHKWADLSESGYGVSLLNDCKYGYSIEDHVMKLSLLKSATYPNPEADRGVNRFTYALYPHTGDFCTGGTVKEAYLLNMPLAGRRVSAAEGGVPEVYSLLSCNRENVVLETIKKAEDGSAIIARMYEAFNQKAEVTVTAGFDFREVYLCDLMEEHPQKLYADGRSVTLPIRNFEILTLKFIV